MREITLLSVTLEGFRSYKDKTHVGLSRPQDLSFLAARMLQSQGWGLMGRASLRSGMLSSGAYITRPPKGFALRSLYRGPKSVVWSKPDGWLMEVRGLSFDLVNPIVLAWMGHPRGKVILMPSGCLGLGSYTLLSSDRK